MILSDDQFSLIFKRFQEMIIEYSGHPFLGFDQGFAAQEEGYKVRLRDYALTLLEADQWHENQIGTGAIINRAITAIEINNSKIGILNNLVAWPKRWGEDRRQHRVLLDASRNPQERKRVERLLFDIFRNNENESGVFDELAELSHKSYAFMAYLFFLKDINRFAPIRTEKFDLIFREFGVDFKTNRRCNWENYSQFNKIIEEIRQLIEKKVGVHNVSLIDAHSFCWLFHSLTQKKSDTSVKTNGKNKGHIFSARERSIFEMCKSVEETVKNSNGQTILKSVKNKELKMTLNQLENYIGHLIEKQNNSCALTDIPFHFQEQGADKNLFPSVDRIDSNGHYEEGNLQIVCRFVNFWKSDTDNDTFKKLLKLVRFGSQVK